MDSDEYLFATEDQMKWWRDAKFGMFIHWGPASIGGGDISWCRLGSERLGDHQFVAEPRIPADVYDNFYKEFNPTLYNAKEWVSIAKAAGMKYMILTTKHHDGFCLFDTRFTEHRITAPDCPFQRDIVKELADACHEAGMKLGLYYSARDWYHPDYLTENHSRYLAFYHAQLLELLCNYGNVDILWFDHIGGPLNMWDPELVMKMARTLQPGILINNRLHISVHHGTDPRFKGDFDTPEQRIGVFQPNRPWESCICLVGGVWSYKPGGEMLTLEQCLRSLLYCAGGDGNLLLNNGPMPDGRIEPRQADRLREIGAWLKENGESIYGTRGGPIPPGDWGVCTYKDNLVYLHILSWGEGSIRLPSLQRSIVHSSLLHGGEVRVKTDEGGMEISVSEENRQPIDTIVVLKLEDSIA